MDRENEKPQRGHAGVQNSDGTLFNFASRQAEICRWLAEKSTDTGCRLNQTQIDRNARKIRAKLDSFNPAKASECIPLPSQKRLLELFDYDEDAGNLIARTSLGNRRAGQICGHETEKGYLKLRIDRIAYKAHRLIFKMAYGREPIGFIDHIDGNRSNNRLENLREATPWENTLNRLAPPTSNTGHMGVSWDKDTRRYNACISVGNRNVHLGRFEKLCCAVAARKHAFDIVAGAPSNDNMRAA
ncbi:MAG: HNH endonuclease [Pseudomonadota bacterium]